MAVLQATDASAARRRREPGRTRLSRKHQPQLTELSSWAARPSSTTSSRASLPPSIRPGPRLIPAVQGDPGTSASSNSRPRRVLTTAQASKSGPRAVGPRPIPGSLAVVAHELAAAGADPAELAALLVRCLLARARDRKLGGDMVALLLHPSCFVGTEAGGRRVRPRIVKRLQRFGNPHIARSFVEGAAPSNEYQIQDDAIVVVVDSVTLTTRPGGADVDQGQVQVQRTGSVEPAAQPCEPIAIRRGADGAWRVVDFGGLAGPVRSPPPVHRRLSNQSAEAGSPADPKNVGYEAPVATFRPVNLDRPSGDPRRRPLSRETPQQRMDRQKQARKDLQFLATQLAADELNREIEANPSRPRVVCSFRSGAIVLRALLPGSQFRPGSAAASTSPVATMPSPAPASTATRVDC